MPTQMMTALGMMSGTSLDGIDAAIIKTDGKQVELTDYFLTIPYSPEFRKKLREVIKTRKNVDQVEKELTAAHFEVVRQLLYKFDLESSDIDVIGFHGQTIDHRPQEGITQQIGDGALLAKLTGINVVNDFRSADVAGGGQGAPLVPLFHAALFRNFPKPLAVLNIGGVANVTYLGNKNNKKTENGGSEAEEDSEKYILAFDTGPGNAMLDDWIFNHTGKTHDENGEIAAKGRVDEEVLNYLLSHPYFARTPPKSLDRNDFREWFGKIFPPFLLEDGAAILTAFTAASIAKSIEHFPEPPLKWYITGGGRLNHKLMEEIERRIRIQVLNIRENELITQQAHKNSKKCPGDIQQGSNKMISGIEDAGFNGDMLEAQAFGFLAVRSIRKLPLSLPTTTGVKLANVVGGVLHKPFENMELSAFQE